MTSRVVLVILSLFALVAPAAAQSYEIRVTWPTRLRESYSLDSAIAEVVHPGAVLQVAGRFNRWLKIDRNGRQVWMADWIDHVRLDQEQTGAVGTGVAKAPAPAQIDNCCFVNRQCATDQQWADGYWAYQRNECPAAVVAGPAIAVDRGSGHAIHVDGSPPFVDFINESLDWLRSLSPTWYDYVITGADRIWEEPDRFAGAGAHSPIRLIAMSTYGSLLHPAAPDRQWNLAQAMSILVHEACHIHRHEAGYPYNGYTIVDEELACFQQQHRFADVLPARYKSVVLNSVLSYSYCEDDLTNHPRCRWVRTNCEWSADGMRITACPAMGFRIIYH